MAAEHVSLPVTSERLNSWKSRHAVDSAHASHSRDGQDLQFRRALIVSAVITLVSWPTSVVAGTLITPYEESEASFLHKLLPYIEWLPAAFSHAGDPIVLGVVGAESVFNALARMNQGRQVHGRSIEVRQLNAQDQVHGVHLLFFGAMAWSERMHWVPANVSSLVLVTNAPGGIDQGATIGFVSEGPRVRIEASLPAAKKAGVKLSSRLLVVAQRVVEAQK